MAGAASRESLSDTMVRPRMQYSYELFVKELGAKLKQMRKDRGWTLRDMVIEHRLHLTQWQRLENGKGISAPSLLRVCEVFNVSLAELVGTLGQVQPPSAPVKAPKKATSVGSSPAKRAKPAKTVSSPRGRVAPSQT